MKTEKESAEGSSENHLGIDGNIFAQEGKALESFHLSEQETTVNGKACYQLYGDVTGTELMGLLGKEMVEAYHLVNLPEEDAIRNLKIPVIFDISALLCVCSKTLSSCWVVIISLRCKVLFRNTLQLLTI